AYDNQDYPFEALVDKLEISRNLSRNPLFDTMLIFQNIPMQPVHLAGLEILPYSFDTGTSKFDISLIMLETEKGPQLSFEYCIRLFSHSFIKRFSNHFLTILRAVVTEPGLPLSAVQLLGEEEKKQILYEFNDTAADYPRAKSLHRLFEEQVEKSPDRISIAAMGMPVGSWRGTVQITYGELNEKSNLLASHLVYKGVEPGSIVGIKTGRSVEMMTGILAILKAGGAYLPIDPTYPTKRKRHMLADSNARLILTDAGETGKKSYAAEGNGVSSNLETIDIVHFYNEFSSESSLRANNQMSTANEVSMEQESGLAYIIYTSGSTGKPKGVMIEHRALLNFIKGMTDIIEFKPQDCILSLTTFGFDIFGLETLLPLTTRTKIVIGSSREQKEPDAAGLLMEQEHVTIFQTTPSRLQLLLSDEKSRKGLAQLNYFLVGGEALPLKLLEETRKIITGKIYNVYGPTETTIWSTAKEVTGKKALNIGKPIANTQIFILDRWNLLQPKGIAGELCIAGDGLARGYINKPELTAERFTKANRQLAVAPEAYLYRTGDLCRWLPDGNIECLGRLDHQVKIRGFRIELEEIENSLLTHPGIKETVVLARESTNGDKHLCAYYVAGNEPPAQQPEPGLKDYLAQYLPQYMLPTNFIEMEKFPLTPSGKLNRAALPEPVASTSQDVFVAPSNGSEKKLAAIWAELLNMNLENVGIKNNFFNSGGHSLTATLLTSRISKIFNVRLRLGDVFKHPTIEALAKCIGGKKKENHDTVPRAEKREYYPLSFHQRRLQILSKLDERDVSFNMSLGIPLDHQLDEDIVKKALAKLVQRHESLRTCFKENEGVAGQYISDYAEVPFEVKDISSVSSVAGVGAADIELEADRINREMAAERFDLTRAPLLRAMGLVLNDGTSRLFFTMHHIISDGWSIDILGREFALFYSALRRGEEFSLEPLDLQYRDFSLWHNRRLETHVFKEAAQRYWKQKSNGGFPTLPLPVDLLGDRRDKAGMAYGCSVNPEVTARLKKLAEEENITLSTVMFSIFNILLSHISGQDVVVCSKISAGRDLEELQPLVGYFVNSVVLKTALDQEEDFYDMLKRLHNEVIEVLEYQGYPLEMIMDELGMSVPEVSVSYNMLNIPGDFSGEELPDHIEKPQGVKFDLALFVEESGEEMRLTWNYRKSLFKPASIESISDLYQNLLAELSS
ncbi:MAG: amino acid adenylation domain-containing protein, partial [bacterium]|nr:amino acid adenylation domain-containing protein [bacterium]